MAKKRVLECDRCGKIVEYGSGDMYKWRKVPLKYWADSWWDIPAKWVSDVVYFCPDCWNDIMSKEHIRAFKMIREGE